MGKDSFQDNQERRSGNDRRKLSNRRHFSFTIHIPERRSGKERRSGLVRRQEKRTSVIDSALEDDTLKMNENSKI